MTNNVPNNIVCTKSHEYILPENSTVKIGITDYAVEQLGDVVFVELPEVGSTFSKGEVFGTVESVKAASELYMPIDGKIAAINESLTDNPELVNEDCYGKGWLISVSEYSNVEGMSYAEYKNYLEELEGE
jgi:glycine cleavage system H protein